MSKRDRTPLSPDFFNHIKVSNDLTGKSVEITALGPDPDTSIIPARVALSVYRRLLGDKICTCCSYIGSHGPQEWSFHIHHYDPKSSQFSVLATRNHPTSKG